MITSEILGMTNLDQDKVSVGRTATGSALHVLAGSPVFLLNSPRSILFLNHAFQPHGQEPPAEGAA